MDAAAPARWCRLVADDGRTCLRVGRVVETGRMSEAGRADPRSAVRIRCDVLEHGIEREKHRHGGKGRTGAYLPGDHVIGTRGVAGNADRSDLPAMAVEREASAEYVDAANPISDQRILGCAEI